MTFKLSSSAHTAYRARVGHGRFAGTGSSLLFFCARGDDVMAKGTVKWFNPTKGFGFIQPSSGGKDVFVHISAVEKAGLSTLNEGQTVEYEEVANRGKTSRSEEHTSELQSHLNLVCRLLLEKQSNNS